MDGFEPTPDFSHVRSLLLDMALARSTERVLELVTTRLAEVRNIALARVWLVGPTDLCRACAEGRAPEQPEQALHLVAQAADEQLSESVPGGPPPTVEHLPAEFLPAEEGALDLSPGAEIAPDLEWTREHGFGGLAVAPLRHGDELLGMVIVYTWPRVAADGPQWQRVLADHTAAAIVNRRSFEEIERLREELAIENAELREQILAIRPFGDVVGTSPALRRILDQVELVAATDSRVLILGESGTGKELVATEIHRRSARRDGPLVRVNCASIPAHLVESEFFGHVRGAFTGAVGDRVGRFETADGGTLFLDEIGELPLDVQAKLLRVLQEGCFERVGDSRTRKVDVRLIAATNRDLRAEVAAGRFREDLYYRIDVFPIEIPPLRARPEDVEPLARHFVERICRRLGRPGARLSREALARLRAHPWPGNVRELQNAVERALIVSEGGRLRFDFLGGAPEATPRPDPECVWTEAELRRLERENLERALTRAEGKVFGPGGAAEQLGVNPNTLASRLRRLRASD